MNAQRWEVWTVNPRSGRLDFAGTFGDREHALRVAARHRAARLFARVCAADADPNADERRGVA